MLLLRGEPDQVVSWAHRGLVPVHVVPLEGWTAVLPAGPSLAKPPYDDMLKTLAGRPVSTRLRAAIGLFAVDGYAVISAHPSGWRAIQTWLVWSPGQGLVQSPGLMAGLPTELASAAGTRSRAARRRIRDILLDGDGDAAGLLGDVLAGLALPGSDLLDGGLAPHDAASSTRVEPGEQHVASFEKVVHDDARHRAELEED